MTISSKFKNVPVEEDTTILVEQEAKLGEYDIIYQKWFWDGITAESFIFANEDVTDLNDEEIQKEVKSSPLLETDTKITICRSESGYTFVNFNFVTKD